MKKSGENKPAAVMMRVSENAVSPQVELLDVALQLRRYQNEIVEKASCENTIAFLPTGAGKTLIACHLISSRINAIRERVPINGKLVAFIAPKKALLSQQLEYIKKNCKMKEVKVKEFTGVTKSNNKLIEYWQKSDWLRELENCEVHVIYLVFIRIINFVSGRWNDP